MMLKIASRPDWNSGVDIGAGRWNSDFGQLGAYQRRSGAPHAFLAPMTMAEDIAAKAGGAPREAAFSIGRLS